MFSQDDIYYVFTWVFTSNTVFVPIDLRNLEPESSENCDQVVFEVWTDADERSRYSNTLLVSLNNRVYFRDHGRGNNQRYVDSESNPGRSYPSAVSSLTFAHPGLHSHTASISDNLRLSAISSAKVINIGKGAVIEECIEERCVPASQNFGQPNQSLWIPAIRDIARSERLRTNPFFGGRGVQWRTPDCCCIVALAS